jgi:uncharacterized protein YbjT (DUF2867 family)
MGNRSAALAGGTGLVGGKLLRLLLGDADYTTVVALTRRSLGEPSPKLVEVITDFDRPERLSGDDHQESTVPGSISQG